jgi:hypothetical protein
MATKRLNLGVSEFKSNIFWASYEHKNAKLGSQFQI